MYWRYAALTVWVTTSLALADPRDAPGIQEHPELPRHRGTLIQDGYFEEEGSFDFLTGVAPDGTVLTRSVRGKSWEIIYQFGEGELPTHGIEISRAYENAFRKKGGRRLVTTLDRSLDRGGGEVVMVMPLALGERWLQLSVSDAGDVLTFHVVDTATRELAVELTAAQMGELLKGRPSLPLYSGLFEPGKDVLKADSRALLMEVASLLTQTPALVLSIEVHTDELANKQANLALSRKQAEALKKFLSGQKVDPKRLLAAGFGDARPATDERSGDARTRNRRVELVRR